jgi:serine/threonine protein kinase
MRSTILREHPFRAQKRANRVSSSPPVDPASTESGKELRAHIERVLNAHYELDTEIGRGGMGVVYRAKDRRLKRTVAIKVLPPEMSFQSAIKTRFLREAETAAQLSHPHIVPIYSVDELEGLVFFVMAYISGDNLAKRLHDKGVLPVEDVRRVSREVADALAYAHERGVVHRDIKPDNILLDANNGRAMVTDFGIARASEGDNRLTATGMAIGTPAYMSPEQAAGDRQIDGRSDLYSLGIVAYQMLVGEPPFVATSTPAMLVKHISERPTPVSQRRSDVPQDLARAVMMCLEKDPSGRFDSASALVTALDTGNVPMRPSSPDAGALVPAQPQPQAMATPSSFGFDDASYFPSAEESMRFNAQKVVSFRQGVAPYLFVNGAILLIKVFGGPSFTFVTVVWTIVMAWRYATLWSDGFSWRDVFKQPQDKELGDVFEEMVEYVKSFFDRNKRMQIKERTRARNAARRSSGAMDMALSPGMAGAMIEASGVHGEKVRAAASDRDEIIRLVNSLPDRERGRVADVVRSANLLQERIGSLALALADLERNNAAGGVDSLESEISMLEGQANPLDAGSEERVRRLAFLKRQRRSVKDVGERRAAVASKLETCAIALRSMKLDVLRLRAGSQTHQHVTSLALDAVALAESVDSALYVADELNRVTDRSGRGSGGGGRRSARSG